MMRLLAKKASRRRASSPAAAAGLMPVLMLLLTMALPFEPRRPPPEDMPPVSAPPRVAILEAPEVMHRSAVEERRERRRHVAFEGNLHRQMTGWMEERSPPPNPAPPVALVNAVFEAPEAKLSIIIDDMGHPGVGLDALEGLPRSLTLAFLPYAQKASRMAREAHERGFEVFLHLPMQGSAGSDPGPGALLLRHSDAELAARVRAAIAAFPDAVGVNNHMGSALTRDVRAMRTVMHELRTAGLLFVDSRTVGSTVAQDEARRQAVPTTRRRIFLDNIREEWAIERQLEKSVRLALRRGTALAIGHPYPETLAVLRRELPLLAARGVRIVGVAELIRAETCGIRPVCLVGLATAGGGEPHRLFRSP